MATLSAVLSFKATVAPFPNTSVALLPPGLIAPLLIATLCPGVCLLVTCRMRIAAKQTAAAAAVHFQKADRFHRRGSRRLVFASVAGNDKPADVITRWVNACASYFSIACNSLSQCAGSLSRWKRASFPLSAAIQAFSACNSSAVIFPVFNCCISAAMRNASSIRSSFMACKGIFYL
ncbi:hypothetical protein [Chitinophaga sp. Ak27]|uniref:hypothetical protein n=1 Tax=Chitinophaga sp. Ak27 TaxID=2726116 RepID=UPI0039778E8A